MRQVLRRFHLPTAAAGLVLALVAVPALASPPHGHGPGPHRGPMGGFIHGMIADDLDLSAAQREEIEAIHDAARAEGEPLWMELAAAKKELFEASAAEPFSEAAVRAAAARLADAEAAMAIHRAGVMAQVKTVLTPEQQARAEELRQRFQAWRDERGGGFGWHHRGGWDDD